MLTTSNTNLDYWNVLTDKDQVEKVLESSHQKTQLVYKHSHTCGICHAAKEQIESVFTEIEKQADMSFVNVKKSQPVSNALAEQLGVRHESPQVLIINQGKCVWHKSHWSIKAGDILGAFKNYH